jgi:hypothetical protein
MSDQLFNNPNGRRGGTLVASITYAELYNIIRECLEHADGHFDFDPDAVCQNICCEVEEKMGIFPNVDGVVIE